MYWLPACLPHLACSHVQDAVEDFSKPGAGVVLGKATKEKLVTDVMETTDMDNLALMTKINQRMKA